MDRRHAGIILALGLWILTSLSTVGEDRISIALDWTPNTNHSGIVAAQQLGYFADQGLHVEIVQPGPTMSIQLAVSGQCDFAVSMQEYVTMARAQGLPVVSIAAVFPHNTSGFATPSALSVSAPDDFEHLRYGGWGSDLESVMIETVMNLHAADASTVEMLNLGMVDFVTAMQRDFADLFWIFYGWDGIHASIQGIDFDYIPLTDLADVLDYYTPVIVTSEQLIESDPELVARFTRALARGYIYAALEPEATADLLLDYAPELDEQLVLKSQIWLAGQSETDITLWGFQKAKTWSDFADWAFDNGLIDVPIDPLAAFTNQFLPQQE